MNGTDRTLMGHRSSKPIDLNIVNNYYIVLKVKLINFRKKFQQSSLRRLRQKVRQLRTCERELRHANVFGA